MTGEATPALTVRGLVKSFDAPVLRGLDLDVPAGAFVALLGPSGCGKTTLLRVVAGHERADAGSVTVAGRTVCDGPSSVAPEKRGVGLVPQEGALFPHLSVRGNIAFGLPRRERGGPRVDELLALVGLPGLGDRMPHELSGGQQQRVAVARALAPEPALVLLDEPFSALDADLRGQVRAEVREALRTAGAAGVLVTHDQQEALSVADVVAVVRDGVVVQSGAPWEVYGRPVDLGVARSLGETVVIEGEGRGATVLTALGSLPLHTPAHGRLEVALRPEQLRVASTGALEATVVRRTFYGHDAVLALRLPDGVEVDARVGTHELLDVGTTARLGVHGPVVAFPRA